MGGNGTVRRDARGQSLTCQSPSWVCRPLQKPVERSGGVSTERAGGSALSPVDELSPSYQALSICRDLVGALIRSQASARDSP